MATRSLMLTWIAPSSSSLLQHAHSSPLMSTLMHHYPILSSSRLSPSSSLALTCSLPSSGLLRIQSSHPHSLPALETHIRSHGRNSLSSSLRLQSSRKILRSASPALARGDGVTESEEVFFDGGVHYGDLVTNIVFGLTLVWLPLTLAAVFRGLFLRYRFTNLRVTILSGLLGGDRRDFAYDVVKEVKVVPRFIGEWGDMAIELKDGTKVDIRCVPKFREIAKYVEERAAGVRKKTGSGPSVLSTSGKGGSPKKGFS